MDTAIRIADDRLRTQSWFGRLRKGTPASMWVALGYMVLLTAIAVFWPSFYEVSPREQDLRATLSGPIPTHPLGTDEVGRDYLARLLQGAGVSLSAAALAVSINCLVGTAPGFLAGYFGGRVDRVLMRVTDVLISFPSIVIALVIIAILGPSLRNAMLAVGISNSPQLIRVVRSAVLKLRGEAFMEATKVMGAGHLWVLTRHVLPNILTTIVVMVNLLAAQALIIEAGLSFIGLGVQPPTASWGGLLKSGVPNLAQHPRLILLPGIAITLTVLALNLIGDGLRRKMNA